MLKEADKLIEKVNLFRIFSSLSTCIILFFFQGLDSHLKSIITSSVCFDSRCLPFHRYPIEWYVRNHLVAGFANSNLRKVCNAKFITFGDEILVVATLSIKENEAVFVYYKVTCAENERG